MVLNCSSGSWVMTLTIKLRDLQSKLSRYVALVLSTYQSHPSYEILLFLAEYVQEMHLSTSHNGEGITEKEACECFQMLSSSCHTNILWLTLKIWEAGICRSHALHSVSINSTKK